MNKRFLRLLLPALSALLFACQSGTSQTKLAPEQFKQKMEEPGVVILDVRSPGEYSAGHLPGAVNVDYNGKDFAGEVGKLDTSKTYLVYCTVGGRASKAAEQMKKSGFRSIMEMQGGYPDWEKAGYPVEKGD